MPDGKSVAQHRNFRSEAGKRRNAQRQQNAKA
jgi:hypothetical protein